VRAGLALCAFRGRKSISAMMRVRNEQEFLDPAVRSVVGLVDEVVIVDNMSDDSTPQIIGTLERDYPGKVRPFAYPHRVARYGEENRRLASTPAGLRSPQLLANFYNWCLARCRHPFILKWDGDTIAIAECAVALERFRTSPAQFLWHTGANLHVSGDRLIAGRPFEDMEPRLFFRRFASYDNGMGYTQALRSPYLRFTGDRFVERYPKPLYVHMKFCKSDRFTNLSPDRQKIERDNDTPGPVASEDVLQAVATWRLLPAGIRR
jgi:hypothetical protein